jgi:hypothetical protein
MKIERDLDPSETQEWLDALKSVLAVQGSERTNYLLGKLVDEARRAGIYIPRSLTTPYTNTIPADKEERSPGNREIEHRIRSIIRWNAVAIILRANKDSSELGGHITSFQSAATLYDIGSGQFWHAPSEAHGGDLLYIQGHSSPGIYARAFMEGRLSEEQLLNYRQEVNGTGLSSYPHPWLMPDFWQFPTVSMGLGPLMAVHEGHVAAEVAYGEKTFFDERQIPSVAYTDPEIAWAGLTEDECKAQGVKYSKSVFPLAASGRAIANGRDEGFTKLIFDEQTHRVIGGGIVGTHAGDLISEICLAVEMGCDATDIGKTIHPHPTLSESVGMAAEVFEGVCTELPPARKR